MFSGSGQNVSLLLSGPAISLRIKLKISLLVFLFLLLYRNEDFRYIYSREDDKG